MPVAFCASGCVNAHFGGVSLKSRSMGSATGAGGQAVRPCRRGQVGAR